MLFILNILLSIEVRYIFVLRFKIRAFTETKNDDPEMGLYKDSAFSGKLTTHSDSTIVFSINVQTRQTISCHLDCNHGCSICGTVHDQSRLLLCDPMVVWNV